MKRNRTLPSLEQIRQLPLQLDMTVPAEWEDRNGHVNVQFYLTLYELGGYRIFEETGHGEDWLRDNAFGMFDLEHHLNYLAEITVGQRVICYNRIVAVNPKRFHGIYFIVNHSAGRLACTLEYVTAGVDLGTRRTAPFPEELAAGLRRLAEETDSLGWAAPVCGVMRP